MEVAPSYNCRHCCHCWHCQGGSSIVVAPGILVICPIDKNRDSKTENWLLAPNITLHIFASSGQFEPHRSMFSTRKRCLVGSLIWGYQNFYSSFPKNGFWAKKQPNLAETDIFGQIWAFLAHLIYCLTKNNADKLPRWFFHYLGTKTFTFSPKN